MKKQNLKKQAVILALGAAALIPAAFAQNIAIVNGKPVPKSRLDALQEQINIQAERTGQPVPEEVQNQLKDEIITREVFMQEAEKRGLQLTKEFKNKMDLARQSILIGELFADQQKKNPVTEAEARTEYDSVVASQAPAPGEKEYKASHILVEDEAEAKKIIAQLKKGGKFEEIAKKQSKDPGSGSNGGDLGWANPKAYVPEFSEAMKALKKSEVSQEPVKSQFGWHIIRVDDVRDARVPDLPKFEDVKPQITQQLERQKLEKFQNDLRAKAKIE